MKMPRCPRLPSRGRRSACAEAAQALVEFGQAKDFRVSFGPPPAQFGALLVGEAVAATVLCFDAHQDFGRIFLPLRRPSQHLRPPLKGNLSRDIIPRAPLLGTRWRGGGQRRATGDAIDDGFVCPHRAEGVARNAIGTKMHNSGKCCKNVSLGPWRAVRCSCQRRIRHRANLTGAARDT